MKSGVAMVQVSGPKIRSLREEQNLTQLYLATAVGVTTETISRWERQEAPTLKEENGLKLAEALAVPITEIVAVSEAQAQKQEPEKEDPVVSPVRSVKKVLFFIAANILLLGVLLFLIIMFRGSESLHLSARRIMPSHTLTGHPFPVVVKVDFESGKTSSLLLKEQLPVGCIVLHTVPEATVVDGGFLKWIDKDGPGKRSFSYIAKCDASARNDDFSSFVGTLLVRQSSRQEVEVDGRSRIHLLEYHWADADKNHIVDDEELLAVYDDFGRIDGLNVDIEEVETIWMGSGYRWNPETSVFKIIP